MQKTETTFTGSSTPAAAGPFFIFMAMQLAAIVWVKRVVPETKDNSLEDFEHYFKNAAARQPVSV